MNFGGIRTALLDDADDAEERWRELGDPMGSKAQSRICSVVGHEVPAMRRAEVLSGARGLPAKRDNPRRAGRHVDNLGLIYDHEKASAACATIFSRREPRRGL
jgi:hypothetical protein